jgi:hypothetical protein
MLDGEDKRLNADFTHGALIRLAQPHDSEQTSMISSDHKRSCYDHLIIYASATETN